MTQHAKANDTKNRRKGCAATRERTRVGKEGILQTVQQEFQPDTVNCANVDNACSNDCTWQVLDIKWCATPSLSGDQSYTLSTSGVSGGGCPYTDDCRSYLEGGGSCKVANVTGAIHHVAWKDVRLAIVAVVLEIYHFLTIVILMLSKVLWFTW